MTTNVETQYYDTQLEELLIVSLVKSPKQIREYLLGSTKEELFYAPWWREVYYRLKHITKEKGQLPTDFDILHDPAIANTTKQALQGSVYNTENSYIKDLDGSKSVVNRLAGYLQIRKLYELHKNLGDQLIKGVVDINQVTQDVSAKLSEINTNTEDFVSSILKLSNEEATLPIIDKILSKRDNIYIPTGFTQFDRVNKGLPRGGLTLVAATTGGGKSLIALHMARAQALAGFKVCLVSLEMDEFELLERRFSAISNITLTELKNPENLTIQRKEQAKQDFINYKNKIVQVGGTEDYKCRMNNLTIDELLYGLKPFNYDVIIIDYLGLLKGVDGDDQWRKLSEAARFCKMFAADNNMQIIALAQVDKEGEVRYSKGMLEHANNSFSWVCGKKERERGGIVEVEQKKARMAEPFSFYLRLNFATMSVSDLSDAEKDALANSKDASNNSKQGSQKQFTLQRSSFFNS